MYNPIPRSPEKEPIKKTDPRLEHATKFFEWLEKAALATRGCALFCAEASRSIRVRTHRRLPMSNRMFTTTIPGIAKCTTSQRDCGRSNGAKASRPALRSARRSRRTKRKAVRRASSAGSSRCSMPTKINSPIGFVR